jgi:2',3'-cyclic-nucleotide 2'-phosphodiesterase / 3'-nucleotidase / 5'-nucleotidase
MPWWIRIFRAALALTLLTACASTDLPDLEPVSHETGANAIRLQVIGRYTTGFFDIGAAAPTAYDPVTRRLFVLSVDRGWIDALDISDPSAPDRIMRTNVLGYGGFPNSIAVKNGIVAVAIKAFLDELPGQVLFLDVEGRPLVDPVKVGAKPVQLAFTPDGGAVVTANQGEASADYTFDPEGSISIINLGIEEPGCRGADCAIAPSATTLNFRGFNDRKAELIAAGVRIFGPNASVAQDLEPEAVAIAPNGQTAWVSLQRNNALAIVDLRSRSLLDIVALGSKDHSRPENALDASDIDGAINIRPWPIRSFYQPDIFAAYEVGGRPSSSRRMKAIRATSTASARSCRSVPSGSIRTLSRTRQLCRKIAISAAFGSRTSMAMPTAMASSSRSSCWGRAPSRSGMPRRG